MNSTQRKNQQINKNPRGQYFMSAAPVFVTQSDSHVRVTSKDSQGNHCQAQVQKTTQSILNSAGSVTHSMINKIEDCYYRNKAESNMLIIAAIVMIAVIAKVGFIVGY